MFAEQIKALGIEGFLEAYRHRELLRFLTCGSVDDGKSTLIGRLLYDAGAVFEDQLQQVIKDSARFGTTGGGLDYALLVDGLAAERQQGITIDVAYRYFATERRKFIIADTPGHEQYTRNMATGAANADLAVILIDARKGVLDQTRRHAFIVSLLGIRHVVVAVNKMDLVDFDQQRFEAIRRDYMGFAAKLQVSDLHFVPVSALEGDNVVAESPHMPWYQGGALLNYLETVHIASDRNLIDLRFPVQGVIRPHGDFRGYSGTVAAGILRPGDSVVALPSGRQSRVARLVTADGDLDEAFPPLAVTVVLEDHIDLSRGDMLAAPHNAPALDRRLEAMVVWMDHAPLELDQRYLIKHTTHTTEARVAALRYRMDVNSLRREEAAALGLNEIGRVALETSRPLAWDPYAKSPATGAFLLIDRLTNATAGAGMLVDRTTSDQALGRHRTAVDAGTNLRPQVSGVDPDAKAQALGQTPFTVWFTGLPRSGKTSLALGLERALFDAGRTVAVLDGESLRAGVNNDLGFDPGDRSENVRRVAEIARLFNRTGVIAIVALVAPREIDRQRARTILGEQYLEVYCDAPLSVCETRDDAGLYRRARAGEIGNVTGIDAPFEPPVTPALAVDTQHLDVAAGVQAVLGLLSQRGLLSQ
ncbi:MAG: sulfate adenylyltransferase subunit CysN [Candidatus Competibacterales bacterium]